jgi:hypothetical protein
MFFTAQFWVNQPTNQNDGSKYFQRWGKEAGRQTLQFVVASAKV